MPLTLPDLLLGLVLMAVAVALVGSKWRWAIAFRSLCRRRWKAIVAAAAMVLVGLAATFHLTLEEPVVRTNLKAHVERLQILVVDPVNAAQRVGGMRLRAIESATGICAEGLIQPQRGTMLSILRTARGRTAIRIEFGDQRDDDAGMTTALLIERSGGERRITGPLELATDPACPGLAPERFAIHGVAEFGHEFRPASTTRDVGSGYLSDGRISMFINAIDRILWWTLSPRLVQVESLAIPSGSRVSAAPVKVDSTSIDARPIWWGIATAGPDQRDFSIDTSTNARVIEITMAGGERNRSELRIGDFSRATQDPNIFWFYAVISALLTLAAAALADVFKKLIADVLKLKTDQTSTRPSEQGRSRQKARHVNVCLFVLLLCCGMSESARTEPVRLMTGDQFGQGWMFADYRGICRIVTAAHVVQRNGALVAPLATDGRGHEFPTTTPVQPDPALDIAILTARPAGACATDGLSEGTASQRIDAAPRATLEFLGRTARGSVHLARRARSMDTDGGRSLVFDRTEGPTIAQGMSGGAILDGNGRPIAIITHTDAEENRANAVRIDVIATLIRTRLAPPADTRLTDPVAGWAVPHGVSNDPDRSIDQILRGRRGWSVTPAQGYVTIDLRLPAPRPIRSVSLRVDEAGRGRIAHLQISGDAVSTRGSAPPPPIGLCSPPPGAADIYCEFAPRPVTNLRLQMRVNAASVELSDLQLGFAE